MRRATAAFLLSATLLLTGGKWGRLSDAEKDHFRALKIFMDEGEQKAFLKLKTQEERDAWLKEHELWDKFYGHDPATREQIVAGDVRLGWSTEMVYMAWGTPFQKQRLTGRPAARSEKLVYRFEVDKDGFATPLVGKKIDYKAVDRYQVELVTDDDTVSEMVEKDDWE
jgi:hypothetical protein